MELFIYYLGAVTLAAGVASAVFVIVDFIEGVKK